VFSTVSSAGKRFSRGVDPRPGRGRDREGHTVDDGTDDLVNLADAVRLRAGEAGREGWQGMGSERLEGAPADRGGSSERSPPEGPGETAGGADGSAGDERRGAGGRREALAGRRTS